MIEAWATKWHVPPEAVRDLYQQLTVVAQPTGPVVRGKSEAAVQAEVRLAAARQGVHLWRNNVCAFLDKRGVPVRAGLANDTKAMNQHIKSADLIGIRPVLITQAHVGSTIGQFVSREVKEVAWCWRGDEHELAQARWALLVALAGGDAAIVNGPPK